MTPSIHPHIEQLITTITTLTGHDVAIEHPASSSKDESTHRWDVTGSAGERYAVLSVRARQLTDPYRALYANLSRIIAHETELRHSNRALEDRFRRLDQHAADLAAQQHSLSSAAYRDSLTGLYRPWYLTEQIRLELARAKRYRYPLTVVLFDVSDGSDEILRELAARLLETCRTSDIVGRVSTYELCAVLADTCADGATELTRRLRRRLDITFTAGGVTFPGETPTQDTAESVLERARLKLHRAKNTQPGGVLL